MGRIPQRRDLVRWLYIQFSRLWRSWDQLTPLARLPTVSGHGARQEKGKGKGKMRRIQKGAGRRETGRQRENLISQAHRGCPTPPLHNSHCCFSTRTLEGLGVWPLHLLPPQGPRLTPLCPNPTGMLTITDFILVLHRYYRSPLVRNGLGVLGAPIWAGRWRVQGA